MKTNQKTILFLIISILLLFTAMLTLNSITDNELQGQINDNKKEIITLTNIIHTNTDAIENYNKDNEETNKRIDKLEKEIDNLNKKLEEITTEEPTTETTEENTTEEPKTESKKETPKEEKKQAAAPTKTTEEPATESTTEPTVESSAPNGNVWGMTLTDTDIAYLQRMAETETCGANMTCKTHVISVAMNRAKTYGMNPYAVITSPNQFAYCNTGISQSTIDAVNYVLQNGDTAQGALFFHSGGYSETFCGRPCIFGDEVGHYFY